MTRRLRIILCAAALFLAVALGAARVLLLKEARSGLLPLGRTAPEFSLPDLERKIRSLSEFRGRPVYLTFWATWCAPCQQELMDLKQYSEKDRFGDLAVVCVGVREGLLGARGMRDKLELPFTVLADGDAGTAEKYWVRRLPTSYLLDPSGRIRWRAVGYKPEELKRLLEGPSVLHELLVGAEAAGPDGGDAVGEE